MPFWAVAWTALYHPVQEIPCACVDESGREDVRETVHNLFLEKVHETQHTAQETARQMVLKTELCMPGNRGIQCGTRRDTRRYRLRDRRYFRLRD